MRPRRVGTGLSTLSLCLLLPLGCNKAMHKPKAALAGAMGTMGTMGAKPAKPVEPTVIDKGVARRFSHLPASTAVGLRLRVDVLARAKLAYANHPMLSQVLAKIAGSLKDTLGLDLSLPAALKGYGLDARGSATALLYGARKPLEKSLGQVGRIVKAASAHTNTDAFAKHVTLSGISMRVVLPLVDQGRFLKSLLGGPLFRMRGARIYIAGSGPSPGPGQALVEAGLIGPVAKLRPKVVWLAESAALVMGVWIHKDKALVELLFPVRRPVSDAGLLRLAYKTWSSPEPTSLATWFVRALGVKADLSLTVVAKNAGFMGQAIGVSQMLDSLGDSSPAERAVLIGLGFKVSKNPVNLQSQVPGYFLSFGAALKINASGAQGSFRWQMNAAGKSLFGPLLTGLKNVNLLEGDHWQKFVAGLAAAVTSRKARGLFALSRGRAQKDYEEGGMFMHLVTLAQCWPELLRWKMVAPLVVKLPRYTPMVSITSMQLTQSGKDLSLLWK